jgi:hypothetical protein
MKIRLDIHILAPLPFSCQRRIHIGKLLEAPWQQHRPSGFPASRRRRFFEPRWLAKEKKMAQERTHSGVLGNLQRLDTALEANSAELAHLEGPRQRLTTLLGQAQETVKQQAALTASKQETSKQLRAFLIEGQRVANALRALLKEHYGLRAEKLAEFGLQPFRGRTRKAKPTEPKPPVSPSTEPGASPPSQT